MKRDKQYWVDKLETAKKNQVKLANEISNIEFKLDGPAKKAHCSRLTNSFGDLTVIICSRFTKIPQYYRWSAFAKLVQLRRKLQMLETTKIPYYEEMASR